VARGAERVAPIAREEDAHVHAVGPPLEPAKPATNAGIVAAPVAVEDEGALGRLEPRPRHRGGDAAPLAELEQLAALPARGLRRPRLHRALGDRAAGVGDDEVEVEVDDAAEAATSVARAERAVEREEVGHGLADDEAARRAVERGGE